MPSHEPSLSVAEIVRQFEALTLPEAAWTHSAHLAVALWYLRRADRVTATRQIRNSIMLFNQARASRGYHETITRAWIAIVAHHLEQHDIGQTDDRLLRMLTESGVDSRYLERFYVRDVLLSDEARSCWTAPQVEAPWREIAERLTGTMDAQESDAVSQRLESAPRATTPTSIPTPLVNGLRVVCVAVLALIGLDSGFAIAQQPAASPPQGISPKNSSAKNASLQYFLADLNQRVTELDAIKQRVTEMEQQLEKRMQSRQEILDLQKRILLNEAAGLGFYSPAEESSSEAKLPTNNDPTRIGSP